MFEEQCTFSVLNITCSKAQGDFRKGPGGEMVDRTVQGKCFLNLSGGQYMYREEEAKQIGKMTSTMW